jgi:hypothetical protein
MASGDTLAIFMPFACEPPSTVFATLGTVNNHPVLNFDPTTSWSAIFTSVMPQNYANGTGVTAYINSISTALSGTHGWILSFERMDAATLQTADSFGAVTQGTSGTLPSSASFPFLTNTAITKGANMDSVVAGDTYRFKITRSTSTDTSAANASLLSIELRET